MMRELQDWEVRLLTNTRYFVKEVLPDMPPDKREEVVARIYSDLRRTLKLFNKEMPG